MRTTLRFFYLIVFGFLFSNNISAQVEELNFQMKYDTVNCVYSCYIIINEGTATTDDERQQFNAQYTVVTPDDVIISGNPISHMPLINNANYDGATPSPWSVQTVVYSPAAKPEKNYFAITPSLSPTARYNDLAPEDTIKIFSLNFSQIKDLDGDGNYDENQNGFIEYPIDGCLDGIRLFINEPEPGYDPPSYAPGMEGGDFSNGFTIGGYSQLYNTNSAQVGVPAMELSATTSCSDGVEIDLNVNGISCHEPYTYEWSYPDGGGTTDQDVARASDEVTAASTGTYTVTVTGSFGCTEVLSIDAVVKPKAGDDIDVCQGMSGDLVGTEPSTGVWTAHPANNSGVTLNAGAIGMATVDVSDSASGSYSFIYSADGCSDTMLVNILEPDAGPTPSTVGCFESGIASLNANSNQIGVWSIGVGSPGTANIEDPNSAQTTVSGFSASGTYVLVWTVGDCSDEVTFIVGDDCGCPVSSNTLPTLNPNSFCGNSGVVNIDGSTPTPAGGTFLWEYQMNGGVFAAASGTNNNEDYDTEDMGVGTHYFRRLYHNTVDITCEDTSNVVSFEVLPVPVEPQDITADPNPLCMGGTSLISVTDTPNATYNWTVDSPNAGLSVSFAHTAYITPTIEGTYEISVTQTIDGCESPAATITVVVNPTPETPEDYQIDTESPSSCAAADGIIRIFGLTNTTDYTIEYNYNGDPQSVDLTSTGGGFVMLENLDAGTYSDIVIINSSGCGSEPYAGPIVLSDPSSPPAPSQMSAVPNPECMNSPITISVVGEDNATFTWTADSPDAGLGNSTTDTIIMTSSVAGFYNISVTQTVSGCVSEPTSVGVSVTESPATPADLTSTNPSVCGGADGSITIAGLSNLTTYTVNYDKNGTAATAEIQTNTNGMLIITGLTEGSYTNFSLTNYTGCTSGVFVGPISLADPGSPDAPANLIADPNPVCIGTTVNLSVDANPNAEFTWSASSADAGLVVGNGNTVTMDPTVAGSYTISVSQSIAGCTSPTSTISVLVGDTPPTPEEASITSVDPTVCGGNDGSIAISGYTPNTAYVLNYDMNATPIESNITSDDNGIVLIENLTAGSYSNFVLTNDANCASGVYTGTIDLSDPNAPDMPTGIAADPNPVCQGEEVALSVDNNPAATYTWTVDPASGDITASETNTTVMVPTEPGDFTVNVTQTVAGCVSPPATIVVTANPIPHTPEASDITTLNPTECGGNDGEFSIGGFVPNTNYTLNYDFQGDGVTLMLTSNGNGQIFVMNLSAGSYSNFIITDAIGCSSTVFVGPVSLSDPGAPDAPSNLIAVPNPVCLGGTVTLSVLETAGAEYMWSASSADAGLVATSGSATTMQPVAAGTYTIDVVQSVDGCLSPASTVEVVVSPIPPTPTENSITATDPQTCGVNDGSISFTGFEANTSYDIEYTLLSTENSVSVTSDNTGTLLLGDLAAGDYSDIRIIGAGGCASGVYEGPVTLTAPGEPDAPTGLAGIPNPICMTGIVNLSVDDNPDATYTWSTSSPDAGLVMSTTSQTTMQAVASGIYTVYVTQTINGCESPAVSMDVEVWVRPATPSEGTVSFVHPACGGTDGSITIAGYTPSANYTLYYSFNGQALEVYMTANNQGEIFINNLAEGIYTDFSIENENGCKSDIYAGPIELIEPCSGTVGSYVWLDYDGDGVHESNESGIDSVLVNLYTIQGELVNSTYSNPSGYYQFDEVLAGDYYAEFIPDPIYEATVPNVGNEANDSDVDDTNGPGTTANFSVVSNQDLTTIKAGYWECSRIGDNVWYDINENDIFDLGENGLNGMVVNLYKRVDGTWTFWEETVTGQKPGTPSDDGWYEFCVGPGTYYIEVEQPPTGLVLARPDIGNSDWIDSDINNAYGYGTTSSFSLNSGQHKLDLGAGYYPEAVAGNFVWLDANYNGLQDYFEPAVQGVEVQAFDAVTYDLIGSSITDEDGKYTIDRIGKVDVYLKFNFPSNYQPTTTDGGFYQFDSDVDHSNGINTTRTYEMRPGMYNEHIDLGLTPFEVLPVEWLFVEVSKENDNHLLHWQVAAEINVSEYIVERRIDDGQYEVISKSKIAASNHLKNTDYEFVDSDVSKSGTYIYRVKQVDRDGEYDYSKEVSIDNFVAMEIRMYPNPATESTSFEFSSNEEGVIIVELFGTDGKLLKTINHEVSDILVRESFDLNVEELPVGVYNVLVKLNNSVIRKKLVKIN